MMAARRIKMLAVNDERGASTRYRLLAHRPHLEAAGFATVVRYPWRRAGSDLAGPILRAADLARDLLSPATEDLLFIQKKTYPPHLAKLLRRGDRPVLFDMDDALDLPPPSRSLDPSARRRYRANFEATVRSANLVLCGNKELASRLPHRRFELLPTPLDTVRFSPEAVGPPGAKVLGWVGHGDNLAYLEGIGDALREVARRHRELRLVVVADREPSLPGLDVEFRPWSLENEVSCFSGIGVGLMPLDDTPWARGKCAFKAIQYMSLGRPTVLSPVGMNSELIRDGENGFLAADPSEWIEALDSLLSDPSLAARVGEAGRRTVLRDYSLDVVARRLVAICEELTR